MLDIGSVRAYAEALAAYRAGNPDEAARRLAEALGAREPTRVMRDPKTLRVLLQEPGELLGPALERAVVRQARREREGPPRHG